MASSGVMTSLPPSRMVLVVTSKLLSLVESVASSRPPKPIVTCVRRSRATISIGQAIRC